MPYYRTNPKKDINELVTLEEHVKSSASETKVLMVLLLVAQLFIVITISTITDLQLFIGKDVYSVPFLGFSVDIVNFFIFAPIFLVFIHYNLLSTLVIHCKLLIEFKNYYSKFSGSIGVKKPYKYNASLFSDFINRIYNDDNKIESSLIHINCAILFCIAPLLTQLYILSRFSDYQSMVITTLHTLVTIFTCYLCLCYWQRVSNADFLKDECESNQNLLQKIINSSYYNINNERSDSDCASCDIENKSSIHEKEDKDKQNKYEKFNKYIDTIIDKKP